LFISIKARWLFTTTTLSACGDDGEATCDAHPQSHTLARIQTPALFNSSFIFSEQTFGLLALSLRLCAFARNVLALILQPINNPRDPVFDQLRIKVD